MEAFRAKYLEKLGENSYISLNGECRLWQGSTRQNGNLFYGEIYVKFPDERGWRKVLTHRLSIMLTGRDLPAKFDCSHVCHNSLCINPNHISLEPHGVNNQRQLCKFSRKCTGHGVYPNCMLDLCLVVANIQPCLLFSVFPTSFSYVFKYFYHFSLLLTVMCTMKLF